ncbi:hypothetical protein ACFL3B_05700 [Gemmatimonadota bacterium]
MASEPLVGARKCTHYHAAARAFLGQQHTLVGHLARMLDLHISRSLLKTQPGWDKSRTWVRHPAIAPSLLFRLAGNGKRCHTKRFFKARPGCDWSKRFYQYANRLAHLHFLREVNGIDAYLVFVYFLNDPDLDGPKTEREWHVAIKVMHEALGIRGRVPKKYVIDLFVDVRELQ